MSNSMRATDEQPFRILVVEDEESLAEGISENLVIEGYHTEIAPDGIRAMERVRKGKLHHIGEVSSLY